MNTARLLSIALSALVGATFVSISPSYAVDVIDVGNGPDLTGEPTYVNAQTLADQLATNTHTVLSSNNNENVLDNINLSNSIAHGPTSGNLTLQAPTINVFGDVIMGSGNLMLDSMNTFLSGKFYGSDGTSLLDASRLSGSANWVIALDESTSIQQAISVSSKTQRVSIDIFGNGNPGQYFRNDSDGSTTVGIETLSDFYTYVDRNTGASVNGLRSLDMTLFRAKLPQAISLTGSSTLTAGYDSSIGALKLVNGASANLTDTKVSGVGVGYDGYRFVPGNSSSLTMTRGSLIDAPNRNAGNMLALVVGSQDEAHLTDVAVGDTNTGSIQVDGLLDMTGGSIGNENSFSGYLLLLSGSQHATATLRDVALKNTYIANSSGALALYALGLGIDTDNDGIYEPLESGSILGVSNYVLALRETLSDGSVFDFQYNAYNGGYGDPTLTFYQIAPVPLPASFWLLVSAVGALGASARKKAGITSRHA